MNERSGVVEKIIDPANMDDDDAFLISELIRKNKKAKFFYGVNSDNPYNAKRPPYSVKNKKGEIVEFRLQHAIVLSERHKISNKNKKKTKNKNKYKYLVVAENKQGEGGLGVMLETLGVLLVDRKNKIEFRKKAGKFITKRVFFRSPYLTKKNKKQLLPLLKKEASFGRDEAHLRTHQPTVSGDYAYMVMRKAFRDESGTDNNKDNQSRNLEVLLDQVYKKTTTISVEDVLGITKSLMEAIDQLNKDGKVHNDIKPANIVVKKIDGIWHCRLVDFGSSEKIGKKGPLEYTSGKFAASEVEGKKYVHSDKADAYSTGKVLEDILTKSRIMTHDHGVPEEEVEKIKSFNEGYKEVIKKLTNKDAVSRSSVSDGIIELNKLISQMPVEIKTPSLAKPVSKEQPTKKKSKWYMLFNRSKNRVDKTEEVSEKMNESKNKRK